MKGGLLVFKDVVMQHEAIPEPGPRTGSGIVSVRFYPAISRQ